jgi:HAD superfamily hydrolase (TIGR01509 family)
MQRGIAIFDMDETLISSDFAWAEAPERLLHSMGIVPKEDLRSIFYNLGCTKLIVHLQNHYQLKWSENELFAMLSEYAAQDYSTKVTLKTGAADCVRKMRRAGYFTCLLTANSPALVDIIRFRFGDQLPMDAWFSTKLIGHPKSDSRIYDLVSGYFGMTPSDCILFDDARYATDAAHKAGIKVVRIIGRAMEPEDMHPYTCVQTLQDYSATYNEAQK